MSNVRDYVETQKKPDFQRNVRLFVSMSYVKTVLVVVRSIHHK